METNVVSLATHRAAVRVKEIRRASKTPPPPWCKDIATCCAYAEMIRTRHAAEGAEIDFAAMTRGLHSWSEAEDLSERASQNFDDWIVFRGVIEYLAKLPAATRREAELKRYTIGRMWLRCDGEWYNRLRAGCLQDDHLLPPSERMARKTKAA